MQVLWASAALCRSYTQAAVEVSLAAEPDTGPISQCFYREPPGPVRHRVASQSVARGSRNSFFVALTAPREIGRTGPLAPCYRRSAKSISLTVACIGFTGDGYEQQRTRQCDGLGISI
jgi:hypothetical protein